MSAPGNQVFEENKLSERESYNRADALERLGGDESIFAEVANLFVAESGNYCQALEDALTSGDVGVLRREAHTVKSMLATFSFESGRGLAEQLEHLAAAGSLDGAQSLTMQLVAAVQWLAAELKREMA